MEMTAPVYYKEFKCLANRCRDNCCRTGWEIDVDDDTVAYYKSLPQPLRDKILSGLAVDGEGVYTICPVNGQCPFLTDAGLCSLVIQLGEEHIGDICTLHPRYREWFPGRKEIGVGLCCEEAARLILSDSAPAEFETYLTDADADDDDGEEAPLYLPLLDLRDRLFDLLQDRLLPLRQRMANALRLAAAVQDVMNRGEVPPADIAPSDLAAGRPSGQSVLAAALSVHLEMEVLEEEHMACIEDVLAHLDGLDWAGFCAALGERVYEYEHLAVYLVFRYFLKAVYDGDALVKVKQMIVMVLAMAALGVRQWQKSGQFTRSDQIEVCRQYSKEVEYSDDNMEALAEAFLFEEELSTQHLLGFLEA
ncbi:MAG: flagellin lysine-N-methylase [Oscillospiraceae bacterium]|nr:flagellin lysine-N-methylase [Oscillospiraceae bacterium]